MKDHGISFNDVCRLVPVPDNEGRRMRSINKFMRRFNYEYDQFEEFVNNLGFMPVSLQQLRIAVETGGEINVKEVKKYPTTFIRTIKHILDLVDEQSTAANDKQYEEAATRLEILFHLLRTRCPPYKTLPHEDFFKYVSCLSCGAHPPEEGNEVVDYDVAEVTVPISLCKACKEEAKPVSWEKLAKAYIAYGLNAKYDYDDLYASLGSAL